MKDNMDTEFLKVYLGYRKLTASSLGEFLSELSDLAAALGMMNRGAGNEKEVKSILEIESIYTGDSIILKFKEGWHTWLTMDEKGNIVAEVPKNLGILLIMGYLLLKGASMALNLENTYLDGRLKQLEIQLKQKEIGIQYDRNKRMHRELEKRANKIINIIINNKDYTIFSLDDIDIKGEQKHRNKTQSEPPTSTSEPEYPLQY